VRSGRSSNSVAVKRRLLTYRPAQANLDKHSRGGDVDNARCPVWLPLLVVASAACGRVAANTRPDLPEPEASGDYSSSPISLGEFVGSEDERQAAAQGIMLANMVLRSRCFRDEVLSRSLTNTDGDANSEVFRKMQSGGTFDVTFFHGSWKENNLWKTVGRDSESAPRNIQLNSHFVKNGWWVGSTVLHEAAHAYGYRHHSAREHTSVPYTMNALFEECIGRAIEESRSATMKVMRPPDELAYASDEPKGLAVEGVPESSTRDTRRFAQFCGIVERVLPSRSIAVSEDGSPKRIKAALAAAASAARISKAKRETAGRRLLESLAPYGDVCLRIGIGRTKAGDVARVSDVVTAIDEATLELLQHTTDAMVSRDARLGTLLLTNAAESQDQPAQGTLSSLQTRLLDGLADFIVHRAAAESTRYLQKRFATKLCGPELRPYLDSLCLAFAELDEKLSLHATASFLQAGATRDLMRLTETLISYNIVPSARTPVQQAALLGLMFFREAAGGIQPLQIAWSLRRHACPRLNDRTLWLGSKDALVCAASDVITAFERSGSVAGAEPYSVPVVAATLQQLVKDDIGDDEALKDLPRLVEKLNTLVPAIAAIERDAKALASSSSASTVQRLGLATRAFAALLDSASAIACLSLTDDPEARDCHSGLDQAQVVTDFASSLFADDIGAAMTKATSMMDKLDIGVPPALKSTLPVLTEFANAKTSQDVATTLNAAAAPVDSYEAKYERTVIALNAFLGMGGGKEATGEVPPSWVVGAFAPVGMHASTPFWRHFHAGLFLSVLDLGALTQVRLSDRDTYKATPNVGVAQLFSPGLFFTVGLADGPLVVGLGAAVTPALRAKAAVGEERDAPSMRIGGFVAFDIPLFPF
jgi:hypothetical protein